VGINSLGARQLATSVSPLQLLIPALGLYGASNFIPVSLGYLAAVAYAAGCPWCGPRHLRPWPVILLGMEFPRPSPEFRVALRAVNLAGCSRGAPMVTASAVNDASGARYLEVPTATFRHGRPTNSVRSRTIAGHGLASVAATPGPAPSPCSSELGTGAHDGWAERKCRGSPLVTGR